eukprot:2507747-Amphidinium_carterae.1
MMKTKYFTNMLRETKNVVISVQLVLSRLQQLGKGAAEVETSVVRDLWKVYRSSVRQSHSPATT